MPPLPDLPPFDLSRAHLIVPPQPAYTPDRLIPLQDALHASTVSPQTPLLLMQLQDITIAFVTRQIVLPHALQGTLPDGTPWLLSFCSACNNATAFSRVIDGSVYTFGVTGMYNAMVLLYDEQTGSYWDHIRGDCVSGKLVGKSLTRLSNVLHTQVAHVLNNHPDALLALLDLTEEHQAIAQDEDTWRTQPQPDWSAGMVRLLDHEDPRLPRLDMGLGVWSDTTRRYYPISKLYAENNALIDQFDGRNLLVYIEPDSAAPMAFFTDASRFTVRNDAIYLDNGDVVRNGTVLARNGALKAVERPLQLFSRWFGFSIKFPGCEIYSV